MKFLYTISVAILLSACGSSTPDQLPTDTEAPVQSDTSNGDETASQIETPAYDHEVWYTSAGWPGEYPPGFSVIETGVSIAARTGMHDTLPRDLTCALAQNATYQLWNNSRVEADALEFVTVSEKFDITISEAAEIDAPSGEMDSTDNMLKLKPGDRLTYLRYLGEGWTRMEVNGVERDLNEMELMEISDIRDVGQSANKDMLWLNLPCGNARGWVMLDEALAEPGILMTPITGYGEARDLTEQDRENALEQSKWADQEQSGD